MKLSENNKKKIAETQKALAAFLEHNEKKFEFAIDCDIAVRIKFVYSILFPGFEKFKFYFRFLISRIAYYIDISTVKVFLYRCIGFKIGKGVFISPSVILDPHFPSLIEIHDYAILGWGSQLFPHECIGRQYRLGRISIGRGAVIGGFTTIRGGVRIGDMAEVSSLSIVCKDVPENSLLDSVIILNRALVELYKEDRGI